MLCDYVRRLEGGGGRRKSLEPGYKAIGYRHLASVALAFCCLG